MSESFTYYAVSFGIYEETVSTCTDNKIPSEMQTNSDGTLYYPNYEWSIKFSTNKPLFPNGEYVAISIELITTNDDDFYMKHLS